MKKSFLLILCLLLTIALVACANNDNKENEDTTAADTTTAEVTTAGDEETSADETTESTSGEETSSEEESSSVEETTTGLVQQHEHTFATEWSADDNGHWHAATCEHQGEKSEAGEHVDTDNNDACDVCEFDLSCKHPLSSELEGIAAGHYHLTDCEHDLVLDLTAHTGVEDGVCDACGYSFDDLIDDITSDESANRVNGGTVNYNGQYETRQASFNAGFGFLFIDENVEYSYDPGVITNVKHSIHLFNNGNLFYVKDENGNLSRESWGITADNIKGYKFSSDMYDYLDLGTDPCGTEDLLYVFYNFAKTNCANNLTVAWGDTSTITFKTGNEYSAKIFVIDFTISANGVITSFNLSMTKYNAYDTDDMGEPIGDAKYTIDDNGVITVADGAVADIVSTVAVAQTEGSREDIKSSYNLDEILLQSYELKVGETVVTDTITVEVGSPITAVLDSVNPTTANLVLDAITVLVLDETGAETWSVSSYMTDEGLYINAYKAGNYVINLTSLNTTKTIAVVASTPVTTEIHAAVDSFGIKEAFDSKDIYAGGSFSFYGIAQNTYADASFTATLPEGTEGATLTELETADGYTFAATVPGTYVVTLTSKVNPEVTGTVTFNVSEAPNMADIFKGTWEGGDFWTQVVANINPSNGTYVVTIGSDTMEYTYELNGTTITSTQTSGYDAGMRLEFNSALELVFTDGTGWNEYVLVQTSTGDEPAAVFEGTYSGVIDNMGVTEEATAVVSGDCMELTIGANTATYYFSIGDGGVLSVVCMGDSLGDYQFRYVAELNVLTIEAMHPMTGMYVELGALANAATTPSVVIEGEYNGTIPEYFNANMTFIFSADGTVEIKDNDMGATEYMSYTVDEYGILSLTYISGDDIMGSAGLQLVYYSDMDVVVVNRLNPMTGMYGYAGECTKVSGDDSGDTGLSIDGTWNSVDGCYSFTFWDDATGNVNFMDANGEWLSTKGFNWTMDADGVITFELKTSGYGTWSGANATAGEGFITIVLDGGETVMLLPA